MVSSFLEARARLFARPLTAVRAIAVRQREKLQEEVLAVKGLMPLLMKPRNGERWSPEDREALRCHLRRLSRASPYLLVLLLPGGFLLLPLLAWWLDRRRSRRAAEEAVRQLPRV